MGCSDFDMGPCSNRVYAWKEKMKGKQCPSHRWARALRNRLRRSSMGCATRLKESILRKNKILEDNERRGRLVPPKSRSLNSLLTKVFINDYLWPPWKLDLSRWRARCTLCLGVPQMLERADINNYCRSMTGHVEKECNKGMKNENEWKKEMKMNRNRRIWKCAHWWCRTRQPLLTNRVCRTGWASGIAPTNKSTQTR